MIDPTLSFSTYLGGTNFDGANGIAVDAGGNVYVTGDTRSLGAFPFLNSLGQFADGQAVFITKLDPTGTMILYSAFIGGSLSNIGRAIAVDSQGNAFITGRTDSPNFPVTSPTQPFQSTLSDPSGDAFVTKLNATGSGLIYSTYLGGSFFDDGYGLAIDTAGNAYVTGLTGSPNFPTRNAVQPQYGVNLDAFVTKINATGSDLVYSTFLGGFATDNGRAIAVDSAGAAYIKPVAQ